MPKKVFISYCHKQGDWVLDRLCAALTGGGAEVLIDRKRFGAGVAVYDQMDTVQDQAEAQVLVLSPDYLAHAACRHEMERAIARDPEFKHGGVIPVVRVECELPESIRRPNPLYTRLVIDLDAGQWDLLLNACGATLGAAVPDWLGARDQVRQFLERDQSVNVMVSGRPERSRFIEQIREDLGGQLAVVDLDSGAAVERRSLVAEILRALGDAVEVPRKSDDLAVMQHRIEQMPRRRLALRHFDRVANRDYGADLFYALRYLVMECRKLVLLVESRSPYNSLVADGNDLSTLDLKLVELKGR